MSDFERLIDGRLVAGDKAMGVVSPVTEEVLAGRCWVASCRTRPAESSRHKQPGILVTDIAKSPQVWFTGCLNTESRGIAGGCHMQDKATFRSMRAAALA